jgi:tRNA-dihydrouridine synthase B
LDIENKYIYKEIEILGKKIINPIFLAPMEGITDMPFRIICREMGADIVFSEFIASEALIRDAKKSFAKMLFAEKERPVAIQIFGNDPKVMAEAAQIVESEGADIVDLNFGCWVRKVVNHNSGAALLKDPERMCEITQKCVDSVKIPVTAKTRLGWSPSTIIIEELAPKLEKTGIKMLTVHCRTRDMGMRGEVDWSYIDRIKKNINIPLILNGDIKSPSDAKRAFTSTNCDAIMIGRAVVGYPFMFREIRSLLDNGIEPLAPTVKERIDTCIRHLEFSLEIDGYPKGMFEFRKHYSGYLKGLYNASNIRQKLVVTDDIEDIKNILYDYNKFLDKYLEENIIDNIESDSETISCN